MNYLNNKKVQPIIEPETKIIEKRIQLIDYKNAQSNLNKISKKQNNESSKDSMENRIYSRNVANQKFAKPYKNKNKNSECLPKQILPYEMKNNTNAKSDLNNTKNETKISNKDISKNQISSYIKKSEYSNISHSYREHNKLQKRQSSNNIQDDPSKSSHGKPKSENESIDIVYDITTYIRCLFHDFRGPLNNISMGIDVLSQTISNIKHPDIAECNDMIDNIHNSCEFMSSTLDGFLNLSKISDMNDVKKLELTYTPFKIIVLIKKVQYLLMFNILEKKITIENKMSSDLQVWVLGDATHLQHVFYNILSNAVKFSKKNSKIIINLDTEKLFGNTQKIIISFIDENEPLPANIKENIFTQYNTSNSTIGTGLGLYICKKIIDLHSGKIYHEYTVNKNNKFIIELSLTMCNNSKNNSELSVNSSVRINTDSQSSLHNNNNEYYDVISFNGKQRLEQESNVESMVVMVGTNENNDEDKSYTSKNVSDSELVENQQFNNKENAKIALLTETIDLNITIEKQNAGSLSSSTSGCNITDPNGSLTNSLVENPTNNGAKQSSSKKSGITRKIKIALVDDSEISRKLLNRLLLGHNFVKKNKCIIHEAIDGLDAISMLHNKIHKFSIIFMDNIMPSISGILASKILRGFGYNNLIFGITGNGLTEDIDEFITNGADYVFVKPFKKEKLDMVFKFVGTYGFARQPGKKIVETADKKDIIWVDC